MKTLSFDWTVAESQQDYGAPTDSVMLLATLITPSTGYSQTYIAKTLLNRYTLLELSDLPVEKLTTCPGLGNRSALRIKHALELGKRLVNKSDDNNNSITTPKSVYNLLRPLCIGAKQESVYVLLLNKRNKLICAPIECTRGTIDRCLMTTSVIFREAITRSASSIILVHNHPTGSVTPSSEDIQITKKLVEASKIIEVGILDHIIIGSGWTEHTEFSSMRQDGIVVFS